MHTILKGKAYRLALLSREKLGNRVLLKYKTVKQFN
jgi:hypothetical protein